MTRRVAVLKGVDPSDIFFSSAVGVVEKKKISTHLPFFFGSLRVTCHKEIASPRKKVTPPRRSQACLQISHATARANAGAWWPCWPSMVGQGSRRPQPEAHEWISATAGAWLGLLGTHPRRPRRARRALLAVGRVPYAAVHSRASSISPPAIEAGPAATRALRGWVWSGLNPRPPG